MKRTFELQKKKKSNKKNKIANQNGRESGKITRVKKYFL